MRDKKARKSREQRAADPHVIAKPLRGALAKRTALTGRSGGAKKPTLAKVNLRPIEEDER